MTLYQVNAPLEIERRFLDVFGNVVDPKKVVIPLIMQLFVLVCNPEDLEVTEFQVDKIRVTNHSESCIYFVKLLPPSRGNKSRLACHVKSTFNEVTDSDCTSCCSDSTFDYSGSEFGPD
jgi:hypothetical protein